MNEEPQKITEIKVDWLADVHTHLREVDGSMPYLIARAIEGGADVLGAMPNTNEGLTTAAQVIGYQQMAQSIVRHLPLSHGPAHILPFVMITEQTTRGQIDDCLAAGIVDGKIYPLNRTTKSHNGVTRYGSLLPIIKYCGEVGMKCHFHPEHPWLEFENRDAEWAFLPLVKMFLEETDTQIVWEHGTDARCIAFWEEMARTRRFTLTLTAHHLADNESRTFGDVAAVCKPPIKTERDHQDLVRLVGQDYPWVMAGGDVAFHDLTAKHVTEDKPCACGAYTGPFLHQLYAHALDGLLTKPGGVQTYVNFTSRNARKFHGLPESIGTITLRREAWRIPLTYKIGTQVALPFWRGREIKWSLVR